MTGIWWLGFFLAFGLGIVYSSFFEWVLHKYVMHKKVGKFDYAFRAHAIVHHREFKHDHTYIAEDGEKRVEKIPMAWWNGPLLIFIGSIPFAIISYLTGSWNILIGISLAISCYYGTYEYIHYCFHKPKDRFFERTGVFKFLNRHHLLHHEMMHRNFNVVLPLADLFLGTLRSGKKMA